MIQVSHPTTAAEIIANAAAVRRRLFPPQRAQRKVVEILPAPTVSEADDAAEHRRMTPQQFARSRCREYGYDSDLVMSLGNSYRPIVGQRDRVLRELHEAYPNLSRQQLGMVFGGMNHSTVFNALKRSGVRTEKRIFDSIPADRVIALKNSGHSQIAIARMLNCSESAVSRIVRGKAGTKPPPRLVADYADEIRALFDSGLSNAKIALELGFSLSPIGKFINAQGWKR